MRRWIWWRWRCSSVLPFVARGFLGDKAQLVPLIQGALRHGGAAFIDVISPCVAFNNHPGSTRSNDQVREHNEAVNRIGFIDPFAGCQRWRDVGHGNKP